jgi:hypothetical protein
MSNATAPATAPATPAYTHVTIILNPSLAKRNGPMRFATPVTVESPASAKGKVAEPGVEMNPIVPFLAPGANIVSTEAYLEMQKSPYFASAEKRGIVRIILPQIAEGGRITGTSADYEMSEALDIIDQASDPDWLDLCITKDDRDGISQACKLRKSEIEALLSRQSGDQ